MKFKIEKPELKINNIKKDKMKCSRSFRIKNCNEEIDQVLSSLTNKLSTISVDLTNLKRKYWGSVGYYELNDAISDVYHCKLQTVGIDGYTYAEPDSDRLPVGCLTNTRATPTTELIRRHIGRGMHFYNTDKEVGVTNRSKYPIFLQSINLNYHNKTELNTVHKILPGQTIVVFYYSIFEKIFMDIFRHDVQSLQKLYHMCVIR